MGIASKRGVNMLRRLYNTDACTLVLNALCVAPFVVIYVAVYC
jgi:hypothetical protein